MAPMVERREHPRQYPSDRSMSPVTNRHSPRGKSSPRRERFTVHHRGSPRARSLQRTSSSHKERSPAKVKLPDRARSPKQSRHRSPVRTSTSRSPSPRTKRLKRAQAEREEENIMDGERGRSSGREERSKGRQREHREKDRAGSPSVSPRSKRPVQAQAERGAAKIAEQEHGRDTKREERNKDRHGEHGDLRDAPSDRRPVWDKSDGRSSRSSRHDRSVSPEERNHRLFQATKPRAADQLSDGDVDSVAKMKAAEESLEAKDKDKQKPSFELSGKLAEETNRYRGVTLLFNEPADACKPDIRWRLYVFKAGEVLNEPLYIHRLSCYLFGRERRVADIPTDHPSCSKQHAVIHYRLVEKEQPDGLLEKQSGICDIARELYWMSNLISKQKSRQKHQEWIPAFCVILTMLLLSTRQLLVDPSIEQLVLRDDLVPSLAVWRSFAPSQAPLVGRSSTRDLFMCLLIFTRSILIVVQYILLPPYVSVAAYEKYRTLSHFLLFCTLQLLFFYTCSWR